MWRFANVSVRGTSHEKSEKLCQDFSLCTVINGLDGNEVLVAVVSDGAGSAGHSEIGSELACSLFIDEISAYIHAGNDIQNLDRAFYEEWISHFQNEVKVRADAMSLTSRDFACTFLAVVINNSCAVFAQIGDGAIVTNSPEEEDIYNWQFWPQQGEYENTTFFATQTNASEMLQFSMLSGRVCSEVALFTDGLQRLALHYQSQSAHSPFFRPFFKVLRGQSEASSVKFTSSLAAFLESEQVNNRTDDDKSLILATRRKNAPSNDFR
ncbi:PP2C family serine/threonine-protein phosphatase [Paenibacillus polymyxa]|uniref:PP2C family serine/threonine-protein phosphatase n=1 Tax=Paenibacillus polymyxa TaxID=1406 RepID=UPI0025B6EFD8|nr:PP2C family serine/threonine-protein phosphatase [Paenibacillus polymyxa]MDN4083287.1 PP2C family serine/threonine-protein phosphatase [Paenibacillus polymyxa]MDN4089596.1 PP2C family serine/threonine-protein phosphatase [Paenibacillus polymyxa]MDN4110260.1 PP2C family serine/threonine-protein phosphatase [Paenibacillus polymyxa]